MMPSTALSGKDAKTDGNAHDGFPIRATASINIRNW